LISDEHAKTDPNYSAAKKLLREAFLPADKFKVAWVRNKKFYSQKVNVFHRDARISESSLNFWIAMKAVKGRPLAFVKNLKSSAKVPRYSEDLNYVKGEKGVVKNMKERTMLVFDSSRVFHGSPEIHNLQGTREAMGIGFDYQRVGK
jgi:hypothetical protein